MTADQQKVVHPQEDLEADQIALASSEAHAMTQELHATIQVPHVHHVQNHPIVFQEIASHSIEKVANANRSIAITAKVASVVHSEIVNRLMAKENHTKVVASASLIKAVNANRSIVITVKAESAVHSGIVSRLMEKENHTKVVANASLIKAVNANHLAELKIQHAHPIKEIIAGIAMRPLK